MIRVKEIHFSVSRIIFCIFLNPPLFWCLSTCKASVVTAVCWLSYWNEWSGYLIVLLLSGNINEGKSAIEYVTLCSFHKRRVQQMAQYVSWRI